ncbi:DNA-processing protein DprA [Acidocella aromatica]|uniref:DNA processing protein n=1 Tax=Acidocella aromatica TaxID=1303579 RepID=A0A840VJE8_9PROT|nr:DNA processing protein [Acidocella aromatica]
MREKLERLRLVRTESVGPVTYRRLLARFPSPAEALDALPALARAGGRATTPRIPSAAEVEREYAAVTRMGGQFLFLDTPGYPEFLAQLPDAPSAIAVLGDVSLLSARSVGIVGARNASANGMRFAEHLGADLTERLVVVSGLARGIDAAAHTGALRAGKTIAVIPGGLDVPYPPENAALQERIAETGAVVAEAPLGTAPLGRHFPKRNRIIAGLVLGLVVIEAAPRSGSLLTARLANEAGRELFGVPGSPLDPRSKGANDLIRQGAHLLDCAEDVFANLPDHPARQGLGRDPLFTRGQTGFAEPPPVWDEAMSEAELAHARAEILALLGPEGARVDEIACRCQLSSAVITAAVTELELAGRVETLPGNRIARCEDL